MRRLYGLVLLLALAGTPITAMGAAILSSCANCCCAKMCPMHKNAQMPRPHGKLCGDQNSVTQCNMSVCNHSSDLGSLFFAPRAVVAETVAAQIPQQVASF